MTMERQQQTEVPQIYYTQNQQEDEINLAKAVWKTRRP